jgi:GT2 family glycosyltransferase
VHDVIAEFPDLPIEYIRHWPPSAAAQRNAGLACVSERASLIGFADDDDVFEPDAFERMLAFWDTAPAGLAGASFNLGNYARPHPRSRATSWILDLLGLYSRHPGAVAPSGWQNVFGQIERSMQAQWLPSTAVIWRADLLRQYRFDEFFDGYSYLEDLDLSYGIGRHHALAVVADAHFQHCSSPAGRSSARTFGRIEVRNRMYFVRKHGLSVPRCCLALALRFLVTATYAALSLDAAHAARAIGNLQGIPDCFRVSSPGRAVPEPRT